MDEQRAPRIFIASNGEWTEVHGHGCTNVVEAADYAEGFKALADMCVSYDEKPNVPCPPPRVQRSMFSDEPTSARLDRMYAKLDEPGRRALIDSVGQIIKTLESPND